MNAQDRNRLRIVLLAACFDVDEDTAHVEDAREESFWCCSRRIGPDRSLVVWIPRDSDRAAVMKFIGSPFSTTDGVTPVGTFEDWEAAMAVVNHYIGRSK